MLLWAPMNSDKTSDKRRLLACLAHPDDETFGLGGTLALYAQRDIPVYLVCATRGDLGTVEPELLREFDSVAELRKAELDCASQALGLEEVIQFDYRDSGMPGSPDNKHPESLAAAPLEEVVDKLVRVMRELRPQVVLTFDPIGGYRHPDHIRMHEATEQAFHASGRPDYQTPGLEPFQPEKLYYHTFPRKLLRWGVKLMPFLGIDPTRWGRNKDIDLTELVDPVFPIHARIDVSPVLDAKEVASACHASQHDPTPPRWNLVGFLLRMNNREETFMRAFPEADEGLSESDLFSGLDSESNS